MRAAIYVRVSTEEQSTEGYSMDAQKAMLQDYCIAEGWNIADIYEDDGYSGRNTKRPEYRRMMDDFEKWDVMLVLKMDRIHRNSRNFMNMMDNLNRKDKMFVSATESLDTTNALGRFVVDMIQRIAQLESEQIGERTYVGMREKAESMSNTERESRTMGFNPPYGYRLDGGILVSESHELNVAREILKAYIGGSTMDAIAYHLNKNGRLTRKGNLWNVYNIRKILHNPIYAGYMRWDDILVRHFAGIAISPEEYNRVQTMIASRIKDPKKRNIRKVPDDLME
ncbi:MAG: recombinase family protein [Candidatus Methanoplasma sp.]|jgi:DNA invertase Pin-like site-specific DNA recombinase|nr:recombinase family protein [Candidatus Methanoplasma sp.]